MDLNPFRVATFNANSLRARLHIVLSWAAGNEVDILCLQETKVSDEAFPAEAFSAAGWHVSYKGQKSYNGVAVVSRHPIADVAFGFEDGEDTQEDGTRLIRCTVAGIRFLNAYAPQGRALDHPHFLLKLRWFRRLRELLDRRYSPDEPVVCCGDLNVAPEPRDVYAPDRLAGHVCFHQDVRRAFKDLLNWGFVDVFRKCNQEPDQYTFYDYRVPHAVKRRMGWRIDHILASLALEGNALNARIDLDPRNAERPSDHTFLVADLQRPPGS